MEKTYVNVKNGSVQPFSDSVYESLGGLHSDWRLENEKQIEEVGIVPKSESPQIPKTEVVSKKTAETKTTPKIEGVTSLEDAKAQA